MTTTAARINNSGTLFISGEFNEVTTSTIRINTTTQYAAQFDEVTYNSTSPAIKNLLRYTEEFNNVSWSKTRSSISAIDTITAPNGTLTAEKLSEDTTVNNNHLIVSNTIAVTSGTAYTGSVYIKAAERSFSFVIFGTGASPALGVSSVSVNLSTGVASFAAGSVTSFSSIAVGNGWYRVSVTATANSTGNSNFNVYTSLDGVWANRLYTGDGTSGIYIWGAQVEVGSTATIYQGIAAASTLVAPGFAKRETSDGSLYVTDKFDEVSGMIVTNGLVLQLDPGKPESFITSSANLTDISGNTRNCTLSGAITYDSTSSSLLFDTPAITTNNRIILLSSTGIDNTIYFTDGSEYTIEFWCKIAGDAIQTYHSIAGRNSTNPWLGILKGATDFNLFFRQIGATYFYSASIPTSVFTGWTQVVFSVSASRVVNYYVNHAAGTFTDVDTVTTSTFTINRLAAGYTSGGNFYAFDGNVGPINIYNRALSAAEVNNNFEALRDRFGI